MHNLWCLYFNRCNLQIYQHLLTAILSIRDAKKWMHFYYLLDLYHEFPIFISHKFRIDQPKCSWLNWKCERNSIWINEVGKWKNYWLYCIEKNFKLQHQHPIFPHSFNNLCDYVIILSFRWQFTESGQSFRFLFQKYWTRLCDAVFTNTLQQ